MPMMTGLNLPVVWQHRMRLPLRFMLALPLVLACEGDNLKPHEPGDASKMLWELELNHRAAMLSLTPPYDTLTLVATPRNYKGEPLTEYSAPRYTSRVFDQAVVTPEGVLRVLKAGNSPIWVVATVTAGDLTQSDSIQIRVVNNATPPVLTNFSAHPVLPDSAKVGVSSGLALPSAILPVQAADANGIPIAGLPVSFRSSDPTTATIDRVSGTVKGLRPGAVTFYASTTAFGVTKTDEVPYRIGWPISGRVTIQRVMPIGSSNPVFAFSPTEVRVGVGATIDWNRTWNPSVDNRAIDIIFAEAKLPNVAPGSPSRAFPEPIYCDLIFVFEPNDCLNAGNIAFSTERHIARTLTAPGTYEYTSSSLGLSGRIVVIADQ